MIDEDDEARDIDLEYNGWGGVLPSVLNAPVKEAPPRRRITADDLDRELFAFPDRPRIDADGDIFKK